MVGKVVALLLLVSSSFAACPAGTVDGSSFNKCYQYFPQAANFPTAAMNCHDLGGSLVSVLNSFENTYISEIASTSQSYWIGLNLLMSSQWSWADGSNVTFFNWAPGQPADPSIYQCGALTNVNANNQWTKEFCSAQKPYMCQIDPNYIPCGKTTAPPSTAAPGPVSCPTGTCPDPSYTLYADSCKCYKYYAVSADYTQSAQYCSQEKATLPVIINADENTFLAKLARHNSPLIEANPWIGLWCTGSTPSSCTWADGTPARYTNFDSAYPTPMEPIALNSKNKMWFSWSSQKFESYICQQNGIP